MNSELSQLIQLQETDLKIQDIRRRIEAIPEETQKLEETLEKSQTHLEEIEQRAEDVMKARREAELLAEQMREKRTKFKSQLMEVKSNKEYQAVLHEIAQAEDAVSKREDEILETMLEADEIAEEIESAKIVSKQEKEKVAERQAELKAFAVTGARQIEVLEKERHELLTNISAQLLARYDKLALAHGGTALAEAKDQSCQACHVKVRPQILAEVRGQNIRYCDSCKRILYTRVKVKVATQSPTAG